jgi:hypothetical protein
MSESLKLADKLIWIVFILCVGFICWILHGTFFPPDTVTIDLQSIKILTPQVKPGEELRYSFQVEKHGIYPSQNSSCLISQDKHKIYSLQSETGALPPGKYNLVLETMIPPQVDPGIYTLFKIYRYQFPWTYVIKTIETPQFEVVK